MKSVFYLFIYFIIIIIIIILFIFFVVVVEVGRGDVVNRRWETYDSLSTATYSVNVR